jgi:hypothetical protein
MAILFSSLLIASLSARTQFRLLVWLIIGLAIYCGYGRKHSKGAERNARETAYRIELIPEALESVAHQIVHVTADLLRLRHLPMSTKAVSNCLPECAGRGCTSKMRQRPQRVSCVLTPTKPPSTSFKPTGNSAASGAESVLTGANCITWTKSRRSILVAAIRRSSSRARDGRFSSNWHDADFTRAISQRVVPRLLRVTKCERRVENSTEEAT